MLIKINLYPDGEMLVNPDAIQWVKPEIARAHMSNPQPDRTERVRFLLKNGKNAYEDLELQAPYSLVDFQELMTLEIRPEDI